jgi:DinB family protein
MAQADSIRAVIARLLDWEDAHAGFDKVVAGLPPELQGQAPPGLPYSPWQLLEHIRLTQRDILEFCQDPAYEERRWPEDYWPKSASPPSAGAWNKSVASFRKDREALKQLAQNATVDLLGKVPAGNGQTYLREVLLAADHTAYHLGELVVVRRALGAWPVPGT